MKLYQQWCHRLVATTVVLSAIQLHSKSHAADTGRSTHPISRIARFIDPELVKVEDRILRLEHQLADYAESNETPLKTALGYRGERLSDGKDPSITLDLGANYPLENIFLIPAQRESSRSSRLFPKRFVIELSKHEDFSQSTVIYSSGDFSYPAPDATPALFTTQEVGRYLRLTVKEGHQSETGDIFGLSEIVVISRGIAVSFNAKVKAEGQIQVPDLWYPEALVDGRTPLGVWHSGTHLNNSSGDVVMVKEDKDITTWSLAFKEKKPIDYLVLFPYQVSRAFQTAVLPEAFQLRIFEQKDSKPVTVYRWTNPLPGSSQTSPVVIPLHGIHAEKIRLRAIRPWLMGDRRLHALSEIQVWSDGVNIARGHNVIRDSDGKREIVSVLTDGFSSERKIIPVGIWLEQLRERGRIEHELSSLRVAQKKMAENSELNAAWASALVLGLSFLIPVFIYERRRLMSEEQLDKIRKRIASDLHDDIGSNLGSISLIARVARKDLTRLHGPEEIAGDLDELENIARESSLAMRDIIWLLERRQDSVGDLVERMRETANRLLREIRFTLECESTRTASKLSLDAKRHLFLFYKEAIHNVLKHSRANEVAIRLWDEEDALALEIFDNGVGLPVTDHKTASVKKLQERANLLQGRLQVASNEGDGTRIRLYVKRSYLSHQPALS